MAIEIGKCVSAGPPRRAGTIDASRQKRHRLVTGRAKAIRPPRVIVPFQSAFSSASSSAWPIIARFNNRHRLLATADEAGHRWLIRRMK